MNIFLDTNIIIDHLSDRNQNSSSIFGLIEQGALSGFISPLSLHTADYLLRPKTKKTQVLEAEALEAWFTLRITFLEILEFLTLSPGTELNYLKMIESDWIDLEDALIYAGALSCTDTIDYLVTNDKKGFETKRAPVKIEQGSSEKFIKDFIKTKGLHGIEFEE